MLAFRFLLGSPTFLRPPTEWNPEGSGGRKPHEGLSPRDRMVQYVYHLKHKITSYSIIDDRSNRSIFLFFVSIFIHNLSLLILPLFIIKKFFTFKLNDRLVLSSVLVAIYLLFLPSILSLKDGDDPTEIDLSILYMILFIFLFLFYIYKFRANILNFILIVPSLIPATLLTIGFVAYRQEMIAERLGMMFIPFIIFDIYNYSLLIQTSFKRKLLQLFLLLLLSVPVLLFTSSLMFLD